MPDVPEIEELGGPKRTAKICKNKSTHWFVKKWGIPYIPQIAISAENTLSPISWGIHFLDQPNPREGRWFHGCYPVFQLANFNPHIWYS